MVPIDVRDVHWVQIAGGMGKDVEIIGRADTARGRGRANLDLVIGCVGAHPRLLALEQFL